MGIEIERRFLVVAEGWRSIISSKQKIRQAYLASTKKALVVRVRIVNDEKAWLTIKVPGSGIARQEFEYEIPINDGEALYQLSNDRIIKTRYQIPFLEGEDWVVDCFEGNNSPLILAELELSSPHQSFCIPDWCGLEITNDFRWSNALLAKEPIQAWPSEMRVKYSI